jgi:uncharacterized membrane protein
MEWQTWGTQNPLLERACGFESHLGHGIRAGHQLVLSLARRPDIGGWSSAPDPLGLDPRGRAKAMPSIPTDQVADPHSGSTKRRAARIALGLFLAGAGAVHLTVGRKTFQAQVPDRLVRALPVDEDDVVLGSGIIEIGLGLALIGLPKERRRVATAVALFFVAVFPGNVSQFVNHVDAFGLDSDRKRLVRLLFQPVLVLWSLFGGEVL